MLLSAMRAERETKQKVFVVVKSNEIKIELAVRNQWEKAKSLFFCFQFRTELWPEAKNWKKARALDSHTHHVPMCGQTKAKLNNEMANEQCEKTRISESDEWTAWHSIYKKKIQNVLL